MTYVVATKRGRSPARRRPQRVVKVHAHVAHGDRQHEGHARHVRRAGIAVGRESNDGAAVAQSTRRRIVRACREICSGQERRDGLRRAEPIDVVVTEVRTVIHARGVQFDRQRDAAGRPELIAVHSKLQSGRLRGGQNCARLVDVEGTPVAKHVGPLRLRCADFEHRPSYEVHVRFAVVDVFRRHDVGAQKRHFIAELVRDIDESRLAVEGERVAGLDLDGRHATGAKFTKTFLGRSAQFVTRRGARRRDGARNAASVVRCAVHASLELLGTLAGENQMRVRIDEAGYYGRVVGVDHLVSGGRLGVRPHPENPFVVKYQRGVVKPTRDTDTEERIVRRQLTDVLDDPRGHYCSRIGMRTPRSSAVCSAIS